MKVSLGDFANLVTLTGISVVTVVACAFKLIRFVLRNMLTPEEMELLRAARETGEFFKLKTDVFGTWIRAGRDTNFFSKTDRSYNERYLQAFHSLIGRNYIRHEGGHLWVLTGTGHSAAEKLKENVIRTTVQAGGCSAA